MVTERDVVVGRTRIHLLDAGAGDPPLVLLHGLGWHSGVWLDVIEALASAQRVIALDLPGHGASDAPNGSYSPAWLAGAVRAVLDALAIERAVLVGNSLGGLVACSFAAAWPDRTTALVLIAPALPNDDPPRDRSEALRFAAAGLPLIGAAMTKRSFDRPAGRIVDERLANSFADPSRVSARVRRSMEADVARRSSSAPHRRALVAATRGVVWAVTGRRERTWRTLARLRVPTLFLWGEQDRRMPASISVRAVASVPGAHLIRLPDAGHTPQAEQPEQFLGALSSFLRASEAKVLEP